MDTSMMLAAAGGLIMNILKLFEMAKIPKRERHDLKDWIYWVQFIFWPFVGALLVYVYENSSGDLTPILALNVGISSPLIINAMAKANPFQSKSINTQAGA